MAIDMIAQQTCYIREQRREYRKGQPFSVTSEDQADALERRRKAVRATTAGAKNKTDLPKRAAKPEDAEATYRTRRMQAQPTDLSSLRGQYEELIGKKPFPGWSAEQLQQKMTEHQESGEYQRRDMRAQE